MIRVSKPPSKSPLTKLQQPQPKIFGTKGKNGITMPHVVSMRPYTLITTKHAKSGHLVKSCHFTALRTYAQSTNYTNYIDMFNKSTNLYAHKHT